VRAIRKEIALPVIGLIKFYYDDSEVYITPTMREAEALVEAGADIIAIDATDRIRPFGEKRETFFEQLRRRFLGRCVRNIRISCLWLTVPQ
jgi:N-acylglucosamine-6-phosphate 2-epimerase